MNEMPDCPRVDHCHCYGTPNDCVCGQSEKVLRGWASRRDETPMTKEQREWCLNEIDNVEGYDRKEWETMSDASVAIGVLFAWQDYCRDKGMA